VPSQAGHRGTTREATGKSLGAEVTILPAKVNELGFVLEILEEAARWTESQGLAGWRPGSFQTDRIREQISRREVFLARFGGQMVGTVTLQWSDAPFWGDRPPDAGYVHKLAVKRDFSGRGFGVEILRWAENQAITRRKGFLRLNCFADNTRLRRYYELLGFEQKGEIMEPRGRAALYEKRLKPGSQSTA
jgi:ribosomal protein S18 acetylase RimI-like enzyme